jgi:8-oxo-dGTP pyrophosphatase MutT (NUDIX family)
MSAPHLPKNLPLQLPLTPEAIRISLQHQPLPDVDGDRHVAVLPPTAVIRHAAVLVPLVNRDYGVQILLTQRSGHLRDHAGQVSFPGGRVEPTDPDRETTALREMEEEVGVPARHVTVLGRLPSYEIPSGFRVTPVVGWLEPPFDLTPNPSEVANVFEAPLLHFLNPAHYQRRDYHFRGRHRHYLAIPYAGRYIWGATAGMLYSMCRVLNA